MEAGNNSIANQTKMFVLLFHDIRDVNISEVLSNANFQNHSIGSLIKMLPYPWDGRIEGVRLSESFRDMNELYKTMGMFKPTHYNLCTSTASTKHQLVLL